METPCLSLHWICWENWNTQTNLGLRRTVTSVCARVCSLMLQPWGTARIQKETSEVRFVFLMARHWNSQDLLQDVLSVRLPRWIQRKCFFPPPGHWSPWCCPWQALSVFATARARCQPSKNRTTQLELHQRKINVSCSNQIKEPQQLETGRATHALSTQTCEPEPKEKQDLAALKVPLWIMTGLTQKRLS